jgi:hypothetical protein
VSSLSSLKPRLKPATMRPLPHSPKQQMHLFMGLPQPTIHDASQVKPSLPAPPPVKHSVLPVVPATQRKSSSRLSHVQPSVPLNPLPMKKHGCDRSPIRICSEVRFLDDPFFLLFCYIFLAISHLILWYLLLTGRLLERCHAVSTSERPHPTRTSWWTGWISWCSLKYKAPWFI